MSLSSPAALPSLGIEAPARSTSGRLAADGVSINGLLLFVMSLLVLASGFTAMRPEFGGLSLHPYLVPVALALPFMLIMRLHEIPVRVLTAFAVFEGMYLFSIFNGTEVAIGELFKMGAGLTTILVSALLVRRRGDFVAGTLGLSLAVALLALRALQTDASGNAEVMEGANKNSYSLFALPAILLAGYIVLNFKSTPRLVKGILIACAIASLAAIFMSANRSGYLGAVVVAAMLFWKRRRRACCWSR